SEGLWAASLLARLGPEAAEAGPALVLLLRDPDVRTDVSYLLIGLGRDAAPGTGPALHRFLDDRDPETRWLAYLALAAVDPDAARTAAPAFGRWVDHLSGPNRLGKPGRGVARLEWTDDGNFHELAPLIF